MGGTSLSAFNCVVFLFFIIIIFLFPQSKSSFSLCKILMFISLLFLEWNMTLTCSWQVSWDSVFQWTETEMSFHRFILRTNHRIALNDRRLDLYGGKQQVFIRLLFVLKLWIMNALMLKWEAFLLMRCYILSWRVALTVSDIPQALPREKARLL